MLASGGYPALYSCVLPCLTWKGHRSVRLHGISGESKSLLVSMMGQIPKSQEPWQSKPVGPRSPSRSEDERSAMTQLRGLRIFFSRIRRCAPRTWRHFRRSLYRGLKAGVDSSGGAPELSRKIPACSERSPQIWEGSARGLHMRPRLVGTPTESSHGRSPPSRNARMSGPVLLWLRPMHLPSGIKGLLAGARHPPAAATC